MTEKEAIEVLEKPSKHIRMVHETKNEMQFYTFSSDLVKAFETAIQSLEEIQQYRAIGTVEGYESAIQSSIENYNLYREFKAKVQEYSAIGTIEEFKALKEKSVAKKVLYQIDSNGNKHEKCPACGSFHVFGKHCTECGQVVEYD